MRRELGCTDLVLFRKIRAGREIWFHVLIAWTWFDFSFCGGWCLEFLEHYAIDFLFEASRSSWAEPGLGSVPVVLSQVVPDGCQDGAHAPFAFASFKQNICCKVIQEFDVLRKGFRLLFSWLKGIAVRIVEIDFLALLIFVPDFIRVLNLHGVKPGSVLANNVADNCFILTHDMIPF
jgi:hypothetical protein